MTAAVQPPGLRILTAIIDRQGGAVRLRIRTHCAQVFDLFFTPNLSQQTGRALFTEARRLEGDESPVMLPAARRSTPGDRRRLSPERLALYRALMARWLAGEKLKPLAAEAGIGIQAMSAWFHRHDREGVAT